MVHLLSENIEDKLKLELLHYSNKPISIIDTNYSTVIKIHILNNNLNSDDIVYLYKFYETQPKEIWDFISKYAENDYKTITNQINTVSSALKKQLLESSLSLNKIGLTEYEKIFLSRHRPKIMVDNLNKQILNLFVRKKWINSFEVDTIKSEYYKVQRSSSSKK